MDIFTLADQLYMQEALEEAKIAFEKDEVPVGAVLVYQGKIIARGHNSVEKEKDVTCHAEMVCIRNASQTLGDWRLVDTTLYVTLEPCSMCLGALILSRVKEVVWAAPEPRHGALGSFCMLPIKEHPIHQIQTRSGLRKEEAKHLLQTFFREKRERRRNTCPL